MQKIFKTLALAPRSIRHKLTAAFALMSVIPMLICGYLIVHYILPVIQTPWDFTFLFIVALLLMLLGFYLARKIIYPIIEITAHAKVVARGDGSGKLLQLKQEDELGELSGSINQLSSRLRENMTELRSYGEKIKQINMEINRKVFALSSLLQIGNLITSSSDLNEVLHLIVQKLSQVQSDAPTFLMLLQKDGQTLDLCAKANLAAAARKDQARVKPGQGLLGKILQNATPLVIDLHKRPRFSDGLLETILPTKNKALVPVTSAGKVIGILGTGSNEDNLLFSGDEIELIGVFAKQVSVAIENDTLLRQTEELAVRDGLTGLYNENYIRSRLDEEIKRAITYQRPCSFFIFGLNEFERLRAAIGEIDTEQLLKKIAQTLKAGTSDIDKVARFSEHQFAVLLPEKNKQESLRLAQNFSQAIERLAGSWRKLSGAAALSISGGISATPIDGTSSVELVNKALDYIEQAKARGVNKIVIS